MKAKKQNLDHDKIMRAWMPSSAMVEIMGKTDLTKRQLTSWETHLKQRGDIELPERKKAPLESSRRTDSEELADLKAELSFSSTFS